MRKVKLRNWIKQNGQDFYSYTGYDEDALFHQWGAILAETTEQISNYTMGIVELSNGEVKLINPEYIKFI